MKIENDDNIITLYLNKKYIIDVDLEDELDLEEFFKNIFRKLKKYYHMDIKGFYNIKIYKDLYYGMIITLEKEEIDYYNYYDNHIDMCFTIKNYNSFLYEIDDLFILDKSIKDKIDIYSYHHRFYIKIKNDINNVILGRLIEKTKIIYEEYLENIIKYGKVIGGKI